MRILMSHPFYWPYVRRGSERFIHELSSRLTGRHQIDILTTKPGNSRIVNKDGVTVRYLAERFLPLPGRHGRDPFLGFALNILPVYLKGGYDIIHSFFFSDAVAAALSKRLQKFTYIFSYQGVPDAEIIPRGSLYDRLIRLALRTADKTIIASEFANSRLKTDFGCEAAVIPPAIDMNQFPLGSHKDIDSPKILCPSSMTTPYKNVILLIRAFGLFLKKVPGAYLQLAGETNPATTQTLLAATDQQTRNAIEVLGAGRVVDLPDLYANAAMTVLPSTNESFGVTLLESLACGTPGVGADHGGVPTVLCDPRTGTLFKPDRTVQPPTNATDLCEAMLKTLHLARQPQTPAICRQQAYRFDWSNVMPMYEKVYATFGSTP